jgi:signal transduction histidine kinase
VRGHSGGSVWPSASPPEAIGGLRWELENVAQLPRVRADLRRHMAGLRADLRADLPAGDPAVADVRDRLVLALDEMASNALRHGGGVVQASVRLTPTSYLVEVSDEAVSAPPVPALDRDPSEGGLGLYLIAEMATRHGWYISGGCKHVWALLPRT